MGEGARGQVGRNGVGYGLGHPWAGLTLGVRWYLPLGWTQVGTAASPQPPIPLLQPPRPLPTISPPQNPRQGPPEFNG